MGLPLSEKEWASPEANKAALRADLYFLIESQPGPREFAARRSRATKRARARGKIVNAGCMDAFIDTIKQYDAKEQAELHVRIQVPGRWFVNLTAAEQKLNYEAEATENHHLVCRRVTV